MRSCGRRVALIVRVTLVWLFLGRTSLAVPTPTSTPFLATPTPTANPTAQCPSSPSYQTNNLTGTMPTQSFSAVGVTAGDALVAVVNWEYTYAPRVTLVDNNGGIWSEVPGFPNAASGYGAFDIWYSLNHPAGRTVVTITWSGGTPLGWSATLSGWPDIATSNAIDTSVSTFRALGGADAYSGLVTTSNANDLLIGGANITYNVSGSPADYGSAGGIPTDLPYDAFAAYQILNAPGQYGFETGLTEYDATTFATGGLVALKCAGSSPVPTPTPTSTQTPTPLPTQTLHATSTHTPAPSPTPTSTPFLATPTPTANPTAQCPSSPSYQTNNLTGTMPTQSFSAVGVTAGDALVAVVNWEYTYAPRVTLVDNNGGIWSEVPGFPNAASGYGAFDIWYSLNHPAGRTVVTITWSGGTPLGWSATLSGWPDIATSNAIDTSVSTFRALGGADAYSGLVTTSNANDLLIGGANITYNVSGSPADYGSAGGIPTDLPYDAFAAYQILNAPGQYGFETGLTEYDATTFATGGLVALECAGSSPVPTPTPTSTQTPTPLPTQTQPNSSYSKNLSVPPGTALETSPAISAISTDARPTSDQYGTARPAPGKSASNIEAPVSNNITISGSVMSGKTGISDSIVTLYAAGDDYGSGAYWLGTATSAVDGTFTLTFPQRLSANPWTYLIATGGNVGQGANSAIGLIAALGPAHNVSDFTNVTINELTTAATEWSLTRFLDPTGRILGAPASNTLGLQDAFVAFANLADVNSRTLSVSGDPSSFLPSAASCIEGTPPPVNCDELELLNTLANVLAGCVKSPGPDSTACAALFCDTTPGDTYNSDCSNTPIPTSTDTLGAAFRIIANPKNNVNALYGLAPVSIPFSPALISEPDGWEMDLNRPN